MGSIFRGLCTAVEARERAKEREGESVSVFPLSLFSESTRLLLCVGCLPEKQSSLCWNGPMVLSSKLAHRDSETRSSYPGLDVCGLKTTKASDCSIQGIGLYRLAYNLIAACLLSDSSLPPFWILHNYQTNRHDLIASWLRAHVNLLQSAYL